MSPCARVAAQAKVNLLLRVLAREQSGYHSIETVFLRIGVTDDVVVRAGDDDVHGRSIDCTGEAMPESGLGAADENLAYRAAIAYASATGWPSSFAIELTKRIPVGGGLGGGSADAGAVLRALDAMSPAPLGDRLPELASDLGSDVPFLTIDSPMALAWGRGERLFPLPALTARPVVVAMPSFAIVTRDAYAWLASERGPYRPQSGLLRPSDVDTWAGIAACSVNEFEPVVVRHHPEIARLLEALRAAGAILAAMSGSGSAVFGVFDEANRAEAAAQALRADDDARRVLVTRSAERVERIVKG